MLKKAIITSAKIVTFLLITFLILSGITEIFKYKSTETVSRTYYCYPGNTFDVIFLGSSVMKNDVYPMQLYSEQGISSYNLGCGSQSLASSYWLAKQAIRQHKPKLIVLDCVFSYLDTAYLSDEHLHYVTDVLSYPEKFELVNEIVPEDQRSNYLFELAVYHNRFSSLNKADFFTENNCDYGAKVHSWEGAFDANYDVITESSKMPSISEEYLIKIIELCKENNIELLLTVMPMDYYQQGTSMDMVECQKNYNYISEIADKYNLKYLNFMYHTTETSLDPQRDYDGGRHLNYFGATKLTKYLGEYIKSNYELPDVRTNSKYDFMKTDNDIFNEYCYKQVIKQTRLIEHYLQALKGLADTEKYTMVFSVRDIQGYSLTQEQADLLKALGFDNADTLLEHEYHSFVGVIDGKTVVAQNIGNGDNGDGNTKYHGMLNDMNISVTSQTLHGGNTSSISVSGKEYSKNMRGFNIVVVDNTTGKVIDSVAFDTHVPEFTCTR